MRVLLYAITAITTHLGGYYDGKESLWKFRPSQGCPKSRSIRKLPQKNSKQKLDMKSEPAIHCAYNRTVKSAELKPNHKNPNRHTERQIKALAAVIKSNGWRRAVVVSKRSGLLVSGHGAVEAAKLLGCDVPVNDQEFASEADEHAHLIADNRLHELSEIDRGSLSLLIQELESKIAPEALGFERSEIQQLLSELTESLGVSQLASPQNGMDSHWYSIGSIF